MGLDSLRFWDSPTPCLLSWNKQNRETQRERERSREAGADWVQISVARTHWCPSQFLRAGAHTHTHPSPDKSYHLPDSPPSLFFSLSKIKQKHTYTRYIFCLLLYSICIFFFPSSFVKQRLVTEKERLWKDPRKRESESVKLLSTFFVVFVEHVVHHHRSMTMAPNLFLLLLLLLSSATLCVSYEPRNHEGGTTFFSVLFEFGIFIFIIHIKVKTLSGFCFLCCSGSFDNDKNSSEWSPWSVEQLGWKLCGSL